MKPLCVVLILSIAFVVSSAFGGDVPAPTKPRDQAEQIKLLLTKIETLEKRIAALEEENKVLRQAIAQPKVRVIEGQRKDKQDHPKFHLLDHTELGVPFSVERAMLGDAYQQEYQLRQFVPQQNYDFNIEPQASPIPEFRLNPEP